MELGKCRFEERRGRDLGRYTARSYGLLFGVTFHATPGRTRQQFMPFYHGSDSTGPHRGMVYDGRLTKDDGTGTWREGLDPRELYGPPHTLDDLPLARFVRQFLLRVDDLLKYEPDLLYFDDAITWVGPDLGVYLGIPDLLPQIMANYYNRNLHWHGGKLEAVFNIKDVDRAAHLAKAVVQDYEIRRSGRLEPYPWQTDTTTGEWHYRRGQRYRNAKDIIHEIVDVVSKNGNVLLNVPPRADGSLDDEETGILENIGAWMTVNGEAIFGTRPWRKFGDGQVRYTTRGSTLYATSLVWLPGEALLIPSLPLSNGGRISKVELLGHHGKIPFSQDAVGLAVGFPPQRPCEHAYVFRITGDGIVWPE